MPSDSTRLTVASLYSLPLTVLKSSASAIDAKQTIRDDEPGGTHLRQRFSEEGQPSASGTNDGLTPSLSQFSELKLCLSPAKNARKNTLMRIQIELGEMASVIINEMGRRCYQQRGACAVNPIEAIARICVETTVAQAIDDYISEDGDDWLLEGANDPDRACKRVWDDLEEPGDYMFALKQHGLSPKRSISAKRRRLSRMAAKCLNKRDGELTISDILNFNEKERGL